jgi:cytochrome c-type biogenesis protein CcmE
VSRSQASPRPRQSRGGAAFASAAGPPGGARPPRSPLGPKARRTRRRLAVCGAILASAIGFLVYKGLTSAFVYFETASQAVADRARLGSSTFQIEGTVVPCTIRRVGAAEYDFSIASGRTRVAVRDSEDPPSLFQPNVPVVLQGHFLPGTDVFASDQILVKHSNEYVAAHPGRVARGHLAASCGASA